MKFISFIASTMLIVLISQHSMALPLNGTVIGGSCSEGFEMVDGQCMPIQSSTVDIKTETFSKPPETVTKSLPEQDTTVVKDKKVIGSCPPGTTSGKDGICKPLEFSTTMEMPQESTTLSRPSTKSKDFQQEVASSTVEVTTELTTDLNDSVGTGGVDIIKGCPEGAKADEQGACIAIQDSSTKKMVTDPKLLLNKNGSCPIDYKKLEGRCVFMNSAIKTAPYSHGSKASGNTVGGLQSKTGVDEQSQDEVVPVLDNNICPEGTAHSEFGLCKKLSRPSSNDVLDKPASSCPDNYELRNGKCSHKSVKTLSQSELSVTTIRMPLAPVDIELPVNTDNLFPPTKMTPKQ